MCATVMITTTANILGGGTVHYCNAGAGKLEEKAPTMAMWGQESRRGKIITT